VLSPDYPIATERLVLRPFVEADASAFAAIHAQPDVVRYLYSETRSDEEAAEIVRARVGATTIAAEGDQLNIVLVLAESGAFVGDISLAYRSELNATAEIGFVIDPAYQGRGFATEGARAVLDLAFEGTEIRRVVGGSDARNLGSAAVLARLGMRQEAHFVENELVKGEWTDELKFAILRSEWRAARDDART
jgi:RimJ/RimL family protein N-acetyltransferase